LGRKRGWFAGEGKENPRMDISNDLPNSHSEGRAPPLFFLNKKVKRRSAPLPFGPVAFSDVAG